MQRTKISEAEVSPCEEALYLNQPDRWQSFLFMRGTSRGQQRGKHNFGCPRTSVSSLGACGSFNTKRIFQNTPLSIGFISNRNSSGSAWGETKVLSKQLENVNTGPRNIKDSPGL